VLPLLNRCSVFGALALSFFLGSVMSARSVSFARSLRSSRARRGARCSVVPVFLRLRDGRVVRALYTWRRGAVAIAPLFA